MTLLAQNDSNILPFKSTNPDKFRDVTGIWIYSRRKFPLTFFYTFSLYGYKNNVKIGHIKDVYLGGLQFGCKVYKAKEIW